MQVFEPGEVLNLKSSDINWHSGKLNIRQRKGKRDRIVWINRIRLRLWGTSTKQSRDVPFLYKIWSKSWRPICSQDGKALRQSSGDHERRSSAHASPYLCNRSASENKKHPPGSAGTRPCRFIQYPDLHAHCKWGTGKCNEKSEVVTEMGKNRKAPKSNNSQLGFEDRLWQAADKLCCHMDAAIYKHVVLGLMFLKYISDAFQGKVWCT